MQLLDLRTYLLSDFLTRLNRASMAYSPEARVPLLDCRVVDHARRRYQVDPAACARTQRPSEAVRAAEE